jgi:hypothetical protein
MHVHPPLPPCASPPPPAMCIPPQPERLVMRKDEAVGNKKKNASLFTCELIIFCSVSTLLVTYSKVYIAVQLRIQIGPDLLACYVKSHTRAGIVKISVAEPDLMGSPGSGSGSRRAKMTHENRKKLMDFIF